MKSTLILLLAVLLSSCTKSTDKQCITNSTQLKQEGYTRWNDTRLFGKSFGESSIFFVVDSTGFIRDKVINLHIDDFDGPFEAYSNQKGYTMLLNQADTASVYILNKTLNKLYEIAYFEKQVCLTQLTDCCYTADIDF